MKKLPLLLNAVLLIAVIILFILVFNNKSSVQTLTSTSGNDTTIGTTIQLPVAYINIDSLLMNYTFAKKANEALISKQENSRATFNAKARVLQKEMADFQRKIENNAFLSRERAENVQKGLLKKQEDLQKMEARFAQEIMEQQQQMSKQLSDTINSFLKTYNKDKNFEIIYSNTSNDNVLFAKDKYDITNEVVETLNKRIKK